MWTFLTRENNLHGLGQGGALVQYNFGVKSFGQILRGGST